MQQRIGFIGAGRIARALALGLLSNKMVKPGKLIVSDPSPSRELLAQECGCRATASNVEVVDESDVVFLAVKPQVVADVLKEIHDHVTEQHLIASVAAGVSLPSIAAGLPDRMRLVRIMPNTPCLVGAGASAFALGESATQQDSQLIQSLLECVGVAVCVQESQLDAVTGLSGSGPAFFLQVIEALSDGGVAAGLPREIANLLVYQTALGTAKLLLESGQHPGQLRWEVTSPGGTTSYGSAVLEQRGVRGALIDAVRAATQRATELGG